MRHDLLEGVTPNVPCPFMMSVGNLPVDEVYRRLFWTGEPESELDLPGCEYETFMPPF